MEISNSSKSGPFLLLESCLLDIRQQPLLLRLTPALLRLVPCLSWSALCADCPAPRRVHTVAWLCCAQLPPLSLGFCSLGGRVEMGHLQSGVWSLRGVAALGCSWCSSARADPLGDAVILSTHWQVWQTLALIIYFCACLLAEEGFSHPFQLHKTHTQKQQCSCPPAEDEGTGSGVAACNSPAERLAWAPGSGSFLPSSLAKCLCPSPHLVPCRSFSQLLLPWLPPANSECWGIWNPGPEMSELCSPGNMMKCREPQLWGPTAVGLGLGSDRSSPSDLG